MECSPLRASSRASEARPGTGEPRAYGARSPTTPPPRCLPGPGSSAFGLVREDARRDLERQTPAEAGGSALAPPSAPGGYWTPACAGVTAEGGLNASRPTPTEGANGSRLSGFACGRDDLRGQAAGRTACESGSALTSPPPSPHPSPAIHPSAVAASSLPSPRASVSCDPGPIGFQSAGEGTPARTPRTECHPGFGGAEDRDPVPPKGGSCRPRTTLSFRHPGQAQRDPGPESRGPCEGTLEQPRIHGGSPVPDLRPSASSGMTEGGAGAHELRCHRPPYRSR